MPHKEFCKECGESMSRVYERGPKEDGQKFVPLGWKCSYCNRILMENSTLLVTVTS